MYVRVLTPVSLGDGNRPAGTIIELDDEQAAGLLAIGVVEPAEDPEAPEAATLDDAPERATQPRARKRG